MSEVFHELMDIVTSGLSAIFFLTIISIFVFGGGLANLIDLICRWCIG